MSTIFIICFLLLFSNTQAQDDTPPTFTITRDGSDCPHPDSLRGNSEKSTFIFSDEEAKKRLPKVQTLTIDRASGGVAEVTSRILSNGGSPILEAGILCSTDSLPNANAKAFKTHFIDDHGLFHTATTPLTDDIKYSRFYVRAYAVNGVGTAYGDILTFIVNKDFHCGDKVYDVEGNAYPTVQIGLQCWTAENMRTKSLPDGTKLQPLTGNAEYEHGRYYYEHKDDIFGTEVYYPWSTACDRGRKQDMQDMLLQGICPDGWHIPTYKEYANMCNAIDSEWNGGETHWNDKAYILPSSHKLAVKLSSPHADWTWYDSFHSTDSHTPNTKTNTPGYNYLHHLSDPDANVSGFNAKPAGYTVGEKVYHNGAAQFWTAVGSPTQFGRGIKIAHNETGIIHYAQGDNAKEGYSVRCVYTSIEPTIPVYPTLEDPKSFSMIFLSDPQSYNKFGLNQPLFEFQTAWTALMRNRLNILTALISGDFVEQNDKYEPNLNGKDNANAKRLTNLHNGDQSSQQQWEATSRALDRLDNVLPYVPCQGNHDCGSLAAEDRRSLQAKYIYPERNMLNEQHIVSMSTNYEGKMTMENVAFEFHTDSWGDLLIIGFEFAPRDEALEWAQQLITSDKYKEHRVIILTHAFLNGDGERYSSAGYKLQPRNWSQAMWEKLIYPSKNIALVLCGHAGIPPIMKATVDETNYAVTCSFRTDKAADGRDIPQMMFNAQCADGQWHGNGGDGWLRIMEFKPDGETISIKTFSPLFALSALTYSQAWRTKEYDQFSFKVQKLKSEQE